MRSILKTLFLVSVFVIMTSDMAFSQHGHQTLYLKNGQKIACDHSWMEGDTLFVVPQGKRYGISYEKNEIDLQRSSVRIQNNVKIQESSGTATEKAPQKGQRSLHTVYHEHYSIAREPSRPELDEKKSNVDALPPSTNRVSRQQPAYRSTGSRTPRSNYPGSSSGKHIVRKPSVPQTYQVNQEAQRKQQQDYQKRQKQYEIQKKQIEDHNKQVQKHNKRVQRHNAAVKRQNENADRKTYYYEPIVPNSDFKTNYQGMMYDPRPQPLP